MLRRAVLKGSASLTQRWLERVVLAGDPACLLPRQAAEHLASTLVRAGVTASPPFLGGESDPAQLLHPCQICEFCSIPLTPRPSLGTNAVVLDVSGPLRKEHVITRLVSWKLLLASFGVTAGRSMLFSVLARTE